MYKINNILYFLFFLSLKFGKSSKFIQNKLSNFDSYYSINFGVEDVSTSFVFRLDLQGDNTIFGTSFYKDVKLTRSKYKGSKTINKNGENKEYSIYSNILIFPTISRYLDDFTYIYDELSDNILSLSYNSINDKHSFINTLYNKKMIDERSFILIGDNFFVGKPPIGTYNTSNKGECSIIDDKWSCKIKNIYLNNESTHSKYKAVFDSKVTRLVAPLKFFKNLEKLYFEPMMKKYYCFYNKLRDGWYYLCYCGTNIKFPKIQFGIGDYIYEIDQQYLFFLSEGYCYFRIEKNEDINDDKFIFGANFLNLFNIKFDFDNKKISLYPNGKGNIYLNNLEIDDEYLQFIICNIEISLLTTFTLIIMMIKLQLIKIA